MLTRRIAGKDHALTSLFYPTLAGAIVVPIFFPLARVFLRGPFHMALFVVLGAMGAIGHWFLIKAHEDAPASTLSPFIYVQLLDGALARLAGVRRAARQHRGDWHAHRLGERAAAGAQAGKTFGTVTPTSASRVMMAASCSSLQASVPRGRMGSTR